MEQFVAEHWSIFVVPSLILLLLVLGFSCYINMQILGELEEIKAQFQEMKKQNLNKPETHIPIPSERKRSAKKTSELLTPPKGNNGDPSKPGAK